MKPNKDPGHAKSYRPICLIPTLSKLLEKILVKRLTFFLEKNQLLSPEQHGFRENRSCETAISSLLNIIADNKTANLHTNVTSIDITGAFDSVNWRSVVEILVRSKCPSQLTNLIGTYLAGRNISINWGAESTTHTLPKGCPQGSCLGPTLWLLIAENLIKGFKNEDASILAFADDFLLITNGKHRREVQAKAQRALETFSSLLEANNLTASLPKSQHTTFERALKDYQLSDYKESLFPASQP